MNKTLAALLAAVWLIPAAAHAQQAASLADQDRIAALERELAILKRKIEVQEEIASRPAPPTVGAGPDGFFLRSADTRYQIRFRGYTQFDSRWFSKSEDVGTPDSFYFRRVRPIMEGTLANLVDFRIMPDLANSSLALQDAYANLRFAPETQLQLGKFKSPVGLERLVSGSSMWFIERALPTLLVPNRDLGVMFHGSAREGLFTYQFAYLNGNNNNTTTDSDVGDDKDFVARLFAHPFQETGVELLQGLGIGIATTYGRPQGSPNTITAATGQTLFAFQTGTTLTGERSRWSPQAYWFYGPFALLGEYVTNSTGFQNGANTLRARASAWQVAGAWVITGENTSWRGVLPAESFDLEKGGTGALELVARFSKLDLDGDLFDGAVYINPALYAEDTHEWAVGVNWYLNRFLKASFNYEHANFHNADGFSDNPSEGVFLTRLQLAY
jgi:phosphate-selective porin OprO/OprP